jgi:hypothetical protein
MSKFRESRTEPTDELVLSALAKPGEHIRGLIGNLSSEATQAIRQLPLNTLTPRQRRVVRRTSIVGCGFFGIKRHVVPPPYTTSDGLYPFLAVISNAQDLSEAWRPEAAKEFAVHMAIPHEREVFTLHVAGQPLLQRERRDLWRDIRRTLPRISHPEAVARLLTRAIQQVAKRNRAVGADVMNTMIVRENVGHWDGTVAGGLIPIGPSAQTEANYFHRPQGGQRASWIFCPLDPTQQLHYGPNVACDGIQMKGTIAGPDELVREVVDLPQR